MMKMMVQDTGSIAPGLTTNEAAFIENARSAHHLFIEQPYNLYSPANHAAWRDLYLRMESRWEKYANRVFLSGLAALHLNHSRVPRLSEINRFLGPLTGFEAKPVSGYVPAFIFFDCLRHRKFPTTITIRRGDHLDYLPEPDIFHDVAGHVPMHTDRRFAETLVRFGECAHTAAERAASIQDEHERLQTLASVLRAMSRFFWFTIEFGLIREGSAIRAYGSGLMSSYGEIGHAVESPHVQRSPLQLEWVIHHAFEIDHYQPLLFVVDSFDHLFDLVHRLEQWMKEGKLDHVAPGEPETREEDLKSFLAASA